MVVIWTFSVLLHLTWLSAKNFKVKRAQVVLVFFFTSAMGQFLGLEPLLSQWMWQYRIMLTRGWDYRKLCVVYSKWNPKCAICNFYQSGALCQNKIKVCMAGWSCCSEPEHWRCLLMVAKLRYIFFTFGIKKYRPECGSDLQTWPPLLHVCVL